MQKSKCPSQTSFTFYNDTMKLQCSEHKYSSKNLCILISFRFFFMCKVHFLHKMNKIFGDVDCPTHLWMIFFKDNLRRCWMSSISPNPSDPSPHYKTNLDSWPQNLHPWNRSFHQHCSKTLLLLYVVLVLIILQLTNHANLVIPCEQRHFQMFSLSQWVCRDVFNSIQTSHVAHSCMFDIYGAPFWGLMH